MTATPTTTITSSWTPFSSAYTTLSPPALRNPNPAYATIPQSNVAMQSTATAKKKIDWPLEVRQYVQRCFVPNSMVPGVTREEMERRLKLIITESTEAGTLYSQDWAHMPLPQELIRDERKNTILATPVNHFMPPPPFGSHAAEHVPLPAPSTKHKRKSSELTTDEDVPAPPWRQPPTNISFADRITAPPGLEKRQKLDEQQKLPSKFDLEKRQKRFELSRNPPRNGVPREASPRAEISGPVVGLSQNLEKNYFRLTAPPKPETVRPLPVLKKTLELLKKKWRKESNYAYICDQFKSLRQDLTVQRIKDGFTVSVYEIHARIALEKGDLGEYNQCQTQLRALYKQKLDGHPMEFLAYRILYLIHTCNRTDMNDLLAELTPADKTNNAVRHALDVRSALALGNYHRFFQLYLETPNMGAYLMDMFVSRERLAALAGICKAYKPDVRIRFVTEELGFESDEEAARFVLEYAADEILQEREDGVKLLTAKAGNVFEVARKKAFARVDIKGQI